MDLMTTGPILQTATMVGLLVLASACATEPADPASQVDAMLAEYEGDVPGASVMVLLRGQPVYQKTVGLADVRTGSATTSATNYRLASITKQFTATAIMLLVERGLLEYETRLGHVFDGFPAYANDITVSHLLSHTSGIVDYEELIPDTATVQVQDRDVLTMAMTQPGTYFEPGSEYRYSNTAYALLALIVEARSGMTFPDFLREYVFEPIGMTNTVAFVNGENDVPHRAFGHVFDDSLQTFVRRDQSITSAVLGDGGVYSSIDDLQKWDAALYGDRILPQATLKEAWTAKPNTKHDDGEQYGYGWYVNEYDGRRNLRHSGSTMGFRNDMERFPNEELTVIVLTNRNSPVVIELARRVADVFLANPPTREKDSLEGKSDSISF